MPIFRPNSVANQPASGEIVDVSYMKTSNTFLAHKGSKKIYLGVYNMYT